MTGTHLKRFESWIKGLSSLQDIRIPRCFKGTMNGLFQLQLHFFSDASNVARGSVCYARIITPDSMPFCRLIMAKSHIAGSGQNTMPRLELEAALDAVKLATLVKREMELSNVPCFFWTDSTIVLQSMRADVKKFSLFPRNRLQQILKQTKVHDWNFVGTKINPADRLTRGTSAKSLSKDETWFEGPHFLKLPPEKWPVLHPVSPVPEIFQLYELKGHVFATSLLPKSENCQSCAPPPLKILIESFSSFFKLKLAAAWFS